ncbi:hypothetical protein RND81_11G182500 [Saponaria officinalis]|uniref:DYW domain-containing protein n=1 Tax=Saponaria officinalis TaxID=3572 RepID=A0AAW1HNI7_SAPOF
MNSYITTIATKLRSHKQLYELHAHFILHSLHSSSFWVSLLITQCTRLGAPLSYTRLVFSSALRPTVYLYTCMLKYFSRLGVKDETLSFFGKMRREGVMPDAFVYPILIKSAGKNGVLLHSHVLKLGFGCDRIVRNAVMDGYAKFGEVGVARKVFDEMSERGVADWNAMISGYWRLGLGVEAGELFDVMPERNVISWTCMVTGFSRIKDLESARWYFDRMPERNVVSWNAMLSGYAQNGYEEEALRLFNVMLDAGIEPDERTWVAVISSCSSSGDSCLAQSLVEMLDKRKVHVNSFIQTALLDMYAKCGNLRAARNIFDGLGVRRNSSAWNVMISAYARVGDLTSARELFDKVPGKDIVSWNSMISGYAQNGQSPQAIELFKQMIETGRPKPDEVTMVSVLSACGHLGALELGNWVVNWLLKAETKLSLSGYNSMIFMYSKCGNMKDALRIFEQMDVRDVVSYNALISGFAAHGHGNEAIDLLFKMQEDDLEPDRVTFIGVLTACSHGGLLEEGRKVFESIDNPSVDHYACMVDLLGRAGKLDEALALIRQMPMEPHAGVYGSLLNASRVHRKVEIAEHAADKLFVLEPENSGNYVLLSNVYAVLGRWKDVDRVRKTMQERGVSKATGWSLVEYGGKMHKFMAGDRAHDRTADIYRVLSEMKRKLRQSGYSTDKDCNLTDIEDEEKEETVETHSEKLAIGFALLVSEPGTTIRVVKNLRVCSDCHTFIKMMSKLLGREIIVRDNSRFHCFKDGVCSCNDYW